MRKRKYRYQYTQDNKPPTRHVIRRGPQNEFRLNEEQRKLAADYFPIIKKWCGEQTNKNERIDHDDLLSYASYRFCYLVHSWDASRSKSGSFATYVKCNLKNIISTYFKVKYCRMENHLELDETYYNTDKDSIKQKLIDFILDFSNHRYYETTVRYFQGESAKDLGAERDVSGEAIRQRIKRFSKEVLAV